MATIHAPASRGATFLALWLLTAGGAFASDRPLEPYAGPTPPPLVLSDIRGAKAPADGASGTVVLLHFFATWCEPCRPELASLDRLAAAAAARGLTVLAVSVAEPVGRVTRFFEANPVAFPVALDESRVAARAWGVDSLPSTFVIDRSGRPRLVARRDLDWSAPAVAEALEPLLAEAGEPKLRERSTIDPEGGHGR